MKKHTFRYCATHREDENYMQKMCSRGWAARKLVEGFWTFEPCKPDQYCYRICYLRGMKAGEIESLRQQYAARGIEFVSRYSFWAIFRSTENFVLYTPEEDQEICRKIYAPMPAGAVISWLIVCAGIFLCRRVTLWFLLLTVPVALYGVMCTWLAVSYHKLLKKLH